MSSYNYFDKAIIAYVKVGNSLSTRYKSLQNFLPSTMTVSRLRLSNGTWKSICLNQSTNLSASLNQSSSIVQLQNQYFKQYKCFDWIVLSNMSEQGNIHLVIKFAKWLIHQRSGSRGRPKSVLVVLQTSLRTSRSLQRSNWVWSYFISFKVIYMVGFDFRARYEYRPSGLIITYLYYQVPIICDFLKILSQATDSSFCQFVYSCGAVFLWVGLKGIFLEISLNFSIFTKIQTDLCYLLLWVILNYSSVRTILILFFFQSQSLKRQIFIILEYAICFLFISNYVGNKQSWVYMLNFFNYSITKQVPCS